MKKILWTTLFVFSLLALFAAPKDRDPEVFAAKGRGVDYTGVYPAHVRTVAVITPASYPAPRNFNAGIAKLKAAGLKVKIYPSALLKPEGVEKNYYAAIPAELRAKDFEAAWQDMENDMIICSRGGRGTQDMVAEVNWDKLPRRPELYVLGYSDVTILLCAMSAKGYGHPLAGPAITAHAGVSKSVIGLTKNMLHGKEVRVKLTPVKAGECSGKVLAGLLSRYVIVSKAGYGLQTAGKIIIIESVKANVKAIRSQLNELLEAGFFKGVSGVVFGHITRHKSKPEDIEAAINDFAAKVDFPVYKGFPFGHHSKNMVVDFQRQAVIKDNTIIFPECSR